MVRRRDVLVPLARNWLEMFLLALCVSSGAAGLLGAGPPSTSRLPPWADTAWYVLLLAGGGFAMVGMWWREAIMGLLLERAGLWPVAAGAGMYALAVGYLGRWPTAITVAVFGLATAGQASHITRLVAKLRGAR